jgi:DNA-binding transcriptional LysR family regulator
MDKLSAMSVFVKVVELGSFTRAAAALEISRTMATTHVARLEEHLHTRLLNRTTRRLSLTEAGTAYHEKCSALLAEIESVEASLEAMAEQPRGVIKISAPVSFGTLHLGAALAEYLDRYPRVKLDVSLNDRTVDLVEEGYDLAIRIARLVDSSLVARRIATTRVRLCASPAYLRRHGAPRLPADLARHVCLGYAYSGTGASWRFEGPQGPEEVRLRTETRTNNGDLLRLLALHGHGIALLPAFLVAPDLKARRLKEVLPSYGAGELGIFALYPSRKYLSAKVRTLVDFLVQRFAAARRW